MMILGIMTTASHMPGSKMGLGISYRKISLYNCFKDRLRGWLCDTRLGSLKERISQLRIIIIRHIIPH